MKINTKNCIEYCHSQKLIRAKKDDSLLTKNYSLLKTQNFVLLPEHGCIFTILLGFYSFKGNTRLAILGERE